MGITEWNDVNMISYNKPIRVAHIVGDMLSGGVEATVLDHFLHIDPAQIQFDFLVHEGSPHIPYMLIQSHGGRVIEIPRYTHIVRYIRTLYQYYKREKPDIVHSHMNALSVFPLAVAWYARIPVRIAHSHSTANPTEKMRTFIKNILRPFSRLFPTNYMACSHCAAQWLFGKRFSAQGNVVILKNAIEIDQFSYDDYWRVQRRNELGCDDTTCVIGQVGRLCMQKNQMFTLDILEHALQSNPDMMLVLVGNGEGQYADSLVERITASPLLKQHVTLLGSRNDISQWYSAFDVLVFPSLYEGLGRVAIEAQAADLHVLASTEVPDEATIIHDHAQDHAGELVFRLPLQAHSQVWAQQLLNTIEDCKNYHRVRRNADVEHAGYGIEHSARKLSDYYIHLHRVQQGLEEG